MTDEFGQRIQGLHQEGDTIVSTDRHPGIFGKTNAITPVYEYLKIDSATGNLLTTISNTSFGVTTNYEFNVDTAAGLTDKGANILAVRDDVLTTLTPVDGDYVSLRTNSTGALWVTGNLTVTASNSVYINNSANLVKDTIATVVTETPASATESFTAVMVSGAGYCEWDVQFGPTATPLTIMHFWTTPSHPTEYMDLPDYIDVTTAQTIRVRGTNREKAASPASDFTGYATLIRKA